MEETLSDDAVIGLFQPLYAELLPENSFHIRKPLLAHYTTIEVLEKILRTDELWFSNPLFMNDLEEVRFGVIQGNTLVVNNQEIPKACETSERAQLFQHHFARYFDQFANQHVLDTYVFCLSHHDENDNDGLLSMWRGYGANGNGVAIVFDTGQINEAQSSPLIMAQVTYETTEARIAWLNNVVLKFERLLRDSKIPNDKLHLAAYALFERIKLFALFTKHRGFKEENEWRVVYMPERDTVRRLAPMFHYSVGPRGVEPKLKFKVQPIEGLTASDLSLIKITDRIILGPTVSSPMAAAAVLRMFDVLDQSAFKTKLRSSTIPFRAII
jgi:hypothetical protein